MEALLQEDDLVRVVCLVVPLLDERYKATGADDTRTLII